MGWFTYYFAVDMSDFKQIRDAGMKPDVLISFAYFKRDPHKLCPLSSIEEFRKAGRKVMLDSGAFTNLSAPGTVKFEQFREYIKSESKHYDEIVMFDDMKSRANTLKYWDQLRSDGHKTLFVDHLWMSDDPRLPEIWKKENKLCLSAWGKTTPSSDSRVPHTPADKFPKKIQIARDVTTRTHLLACGSLYRMLMYSDVIDSVDSAAWDRSVGFGKIMDVEQKEVAGVNVPVLRGYDLPYGMGRKNDRPATKGLLSTLSEFKRKIGFNKPANTVLLRVFNVFQIERYVKLLNAMDPKRLITAFSEKAKAKGITKSYFYVRDEVWDEPEDEEYLDALQAVEEVSQEQADAVLKRAGEMLKRVPPRDAPMEDKRREQQARARRYGIEALEGAGESLSFPAGFPTNEDSYGDPVNLKFPIKERGRAANARTRFKQFADTYQQEKSKRVVHERIVRGELEHGIKPSYDENDPLDKLLPQDLKDELSKRDEVAKPDVPDQPRPDQPTTSVAIQSLILAKEHFETENDAKKWVKDHDFSVEGMDQNEASWRFRQRNPDEFQEDSFRTVDVTEGVKAVVGRLKGRQQAEKSLQRNWMNEFVINVYEEPLVKGETSPFLEHAQTWVKDRGLLGSDSDYGGMLGRAVIRMAKLFSKEGHSGASAHYARAYFNWLCDAWDGMHTLILNDKDYKKVRSVLAKSAIDHIEDIIATSEPEGGCGNCEECQLPQEVELLPVDKANEEAQIVFGIVLQPGVVDSQGDKISEEEIEQAAHKWLAKYQNRGLMHRKLINNKVEIYQSYIAPANLTIGGQKVKKGSWLMMYHILDKEIWAKIKRGELTGFSIGGFARRTRLQAA